MLGELPGIEEDVARHQDPIGEEIARDLASAVVPEPREATENHFLEVEEKATELHVDGVADRLVLDHVLDEAALVESAEVGGSRWLVRDFSIDSGESDLRRLLHVFQDGRS